MLFRSPSQLSLVVQPHAEPPFRPSTFRLPSRVTLHEQKRESWFNDLANPAIPLSKLSRTVPHGYRGEKLLDMLFARQAPIARAVWYIRAMGAVEIVRFPRLIRCRVS